MEQISTAIEQWKKGKIEDSQMALIFFVECHAFKYPNKKIIELIKEGKHLQAFHNCRFKKVKEKALESLRKWVNHEWDFKLIAGIPTPLEVLESQSKGVRPVSIIFQNQFKPILNRDDCLEFFLHDLEHGYMFFHNDELKQMQINFFSNVLKSMEQKLWEKYLRDKEFQNKFHYLISDMNTHIEHYRHFLKAMLPQGEFNRFEILFESGNNANAC